MVSAEVRTFLEHYDSISPMPGDEFWAELTDSIEYNGDYPERHHFDRTQRRRIWAQEDTWLVGAISVRAWSWHDLRWERVLGLVR